MSKNSAMKSLDTFRYHGMTARGKRVTGELSGTSIALVKAQLRKQGIIPSKVKRKSKSLFALHNQKITPKDIALVTRQITTMLMAGVPLIQTINMIGASATNKSIKIREMMLNPP